MPYDSRVNNLVIYIGYGDRGKKKKQAIKDIAQKLNKSLADLIIDDLTAAHPELAETFKSIDSEFPLRRTDSI